MENDSGYLAVIGRKGTEDADMNNNWPEQLDADGHLLVRGVFDETELVHLRADLAAALDAVVARDDHRNGSGGGDSKVAASSIRGKSGRVYAARNLLAIFPAAVDLWRREPLVTLLRETLGDNYGLVRGLYFDKHPEKSWSLPWHKDLAIAVKRNDQPRSGIAIRRPNRACRMSKRRRGCWSRCSRCGFISTPSPRRTVRWRSCRARTRTASLITTPMARCDTY